MNTPRKEYRRSDKLDPDLRLELLTAGRSFRAFVTEHPDDPEHPMVMLRINRAIGSMDLSLLTGTELDALEVFFRDTLDLARTVVSDLDAIAAAAAAEGDTSYKRLWRPEPRYRLIEHN